ncbi:MAG: NADH-quinone oxidoreductase subunit C [Zoogloeaceae bacterium]|jgi:NADH-quinone oxidoreductase subunit C|nr:NADH-quinone oxidoreductase subunit C [Zoogloeaceae bacterium]
MSAKLETLENRLRATLGARIARFVVALGEITIETKVADYVETMRLLRDTPELDFDLLVDLCGVDYSTYGDGWTGRRYAAVTHLLSLAHNWRVRVRVFAEADDFPVLPSIVPIWNSVNWYEREAFDLFGILFEGHTDLRRILTDYNFVGHPLCKDFPLAGHMEMRYDEKEGRVVYQPVSIVPREVAPRVRHEPGYGEAHD